MKYLTSIWNIALVIALSTATFGIQAGVTEGIQSYDKGHYANALQELLPLAEEGDSDAQYYLGLMFDEGKGVREDPVQARQWYQRAAQAGHSDAQFRLGRIYAEGKGVLANGNTASYWYLQAAGQGNLDAQYSLGAMFKQGKGVPVDLVQAYLWFSRAANQGLANAVVQRDFLKKKLNPEQLAEAEAILADVANARKQAERERELEQERERQRIAAAEAERKAREEAKRRAREEAARLAAEAEAAQQAAAQQAEKSAERAAAQKAAEEKARAAQAAKAAQEAQEKAEAEAEAAVIAATQAMVKAKQDERAQLQALFETWFAADAKESADRLKNFNPDKTIIASKLLSVDEIKFTEMADGSGMVYVKYVMQKLQKGEGEPKTKSGSRWIKVQRTEQGFAVVDD